MAGNPNSFQITTIPKKNGVGNRISKIYRKRQIIVSVIGAYLIIGGLLGFVLFNSSNESAKAGNENGRVTPAIDFVERGVEDLSLGDSIEIRLTLQNRSSTESVNNLVVEFFSTKDSISWGELQNQTRTETISPVVGQNGVYKLPVLTSGERAEFFARGSIQKDEANFLTVLAKIRYINREGQQEANSNRVFTELKKTSFSESSLISLTLPKESFLPGEEVPINLDIPQKDLLSEDFKLSGKIYLSKKESDLVIDSLRCDIDVSGVCTQTFTGLESGIYSSLFVSDDESRFSEIVEFVVTGSENEFKINSQSVVSFPFGSRSINGLVPVIASRVINLNQDVAPEDVCVFEVLRGQEVVSQVQTRVDSERNCRAVIESTQVPGGEGVYGIRLLGTSQIREVSFTRKQTGLTSLQSGITSFSKGSSVDILVNGLNNIDGTPKNNEAVTLGIWHQNSGEYIEIQSQNGERFLIINGQFNIRLNSDNFEKGGLYSIYMRTESGIQSDFLRVSFDDKETGLVSSGVIIDNYSSLKAGEPITVGLEGLTDKAGNQIAQGECTAALYSRSTATNPNLIPGLINNGNCLVDVPEGEITSDGPLLITFTSPQIQNKINQSKHFNVSAGVTSEFGQINLEYEPARKNYANMVFIGPVTDFYGNLISGENLSLQVYEGADLVREFVNIITDEGYARVTLPSVLLQSDQITLKVLNSEKTEVLAKDLFTEEDNSPLVLPVINGQLDGNSNLEAELANVNLSEGGQCTMTYIRSKDKSLTETGIYNEEEGVCSFDWNIPDFRDAKRALVILETPAKRFSSVIQLKSGDASNLFSLSPSVRVDNRDQLNISLLSSVVTDKFGLPLDIGTARIEFNGKVNETEIVNGIFEQFVSANDLNNRDIRSSFGSTYLDLSLEGSAGITSISDTNSISIYLGDKEIASEKSKFEIIDAQSNIMKDTRHIFSFNSESCNVLQISGNQLETRNLKTHTQGGICYVQVEPMEGMQRLQFEERGFTFGTFDVQGSSERNTISWCSVSPCVIQVNAPLNSLIKATIFDDNNEYTFQSEELENIVKISQNGLSPIRKYLIKLEYELANGETVSAYKRVSGEHLKPQE